MTIELIILLSITLYIGPQLSAVPADAFKEAGAYLGARIERQLDTGAGFQEKALEVDRAMRWTAQ